MDQRGSNMCFAQFKEDNLALEELMTTTADAALLMMRLARLVHLKASCHVRCFLPPTRQDRVALVDIVIKPVTKK